MEWLAHVSIWVLAPAIFIARITDVSIGTLRTISVVQGRVRLSVVLGFFEVLIWALAVTQVIARLHESPVLLLAYAAGYATGNAVGIALDRRLALGTAVLRFITHADGAELASILRAHGQAVTTFAGLGRDGPISLLYVVCARKKIPKIVADARAVDPDIFFVAEPVQSMRTAMTTIRAHDTGFGSVFKKK
ncbi:MAG: DUF5698 domain-containing protein [Pseudomonadota bacterium]